MSREKGISGFSGSFEPQVSMPLDARMVVSSLGDLVLPATWTAHDGNIYVYKGMLVVVHSDVNIENNGVYFLKDLPYTISANWVKSGSNGGTGHTHADPLATTRVMTYVPEFKAYEVVE